MPDLCAQKLRFMFDMNQTQKVFMRGVLPLNHRRIRYLFTKCDNRNVVCRPLQPESPATLVRTPPVELPTYDWGNPGEIIVINFIRAPYILRMRCDISFNRPNVYHLSHYQTWIRTNRTTATLSFFIIRTLSKSKRTQGWLLHRISRDANRPTIYICHLQYKSRGHLWPVRCTNIYH